MTFRPLPFAIGMIFVLQVQIVDGECPTIYQMIAKDHSYCSKKNSLRSSPPTDNEIELILQMHNEERSKVNAKDMEKMYWNSDLAEIAQRYAEHCDFKHDTSTQREAPRLPIASGQNLGRGYPTWTQAIKFWIDEKNDFTYGSPTQKGVVGHYTQMVRSTSALIGCGLAICPPDSADPHHDWPHYVCNYVTSQLKDNKPYTPADPSDSNNKPLHDCRGSVCLYNGVLDLDSCQCKCASYASGSVCENLDCSTLSDQCDYGEDKSLCTTYANVPSECPKFCGLCDRYDEIKNSFSSVKSFAYVSKSSSFIQLIIVLVFDVLILIR